MNAYLLACGDCPEAKLESVHSPSPSTTSPGHASRPEYHHCGSQLCPIIEHEDSNPANQVSWTTHCTVNFDRKPQSICLVGENGFAHRTSAYVSQTDNEDGYGFAICVGHVNLGECQGAAIGALIDLET